MKTRDKIKYAFASFLGIMTVLAITGLVMARYERQKTTEAQEAMIQQTLTIYGQNGALPQKVELPDSNAPAAPPAQ